MFGYYDFDCYQLFLTNMKNAVLALFEDHAYTDRAIHQLENYGYDSKNFSIIMKDGMERNRGERTVKGAVSEAFTGGAIGALTGFLIGAGALTIPGIGAILIGGPITTALGLTGRAATAISAGLTGTLAGGLIGALFTLGLPRETARRYEEKIKKGAILLTIPSQIGEEDEIEQILNENGASDIVKVPEMNRRKYRGHHDEQHTLHFAH